MTGGGAFGQEDRCVRRIRAEGHEETVTDEEQGSKNSTHDLREVGDQHDLWDDNYIRC